MGLSGNDPQSALNMGQQSSLGGKPQVSSEISQKVSAQRHSGGNESQLIGNILGTNLSNSNVSNP